MRTRLQALLVMSLVVAACERSPNSPVRAAAPPARVSRQSGEIEEPRFWRDQPDSVLWANISRGGGAAIVGLKESGSDRGVRRGKVMVRRQSLAAASSALARTSGVTIVRRDQRLPILRVRIGSLAALRLLRALPTVDYVEPAFDFSMPEGRFFQNTCGGGGFQGGMYTIAPGDSFSVHFRHPLVQIDTAWTYSNGEGITIGLVDTGIDPGQPQLNSEFAAGMSSGRTVTSTYVIGGSGSDGCGHGTHMAGVLAAPRDGQNVLGIAWKANLYSVRVNDDPFLASNDVDAVRQGIAMAASASRIIVLAFASLSGYSSIADEIAYWYYNHDRLFIAAGGNIACNNPPWTSCEGSLFPASLSTTTGASGTTTTCSECLYGSAIDFEALTGQPTTGAVSLGSGHPPIGVSSQSSGATAVIAGIAALIWSKQPFWTRYQVLSKMVTCSNNYPNPNSHHGWGVLNALCGVRPPWHFTINGPSTLQGGGEFPPPYHATALYTISLANGQAPYTFDWVVDDTSTGTCTSSGSCYISFPSHGVEYGYGPDYRTHTLVVIATDALGSRFVAERQIEVNCTHWDGSPCAY